MLAKTTKQYQPCVETMPSTGQIPSNNARGQMIGRRFADVGMPDGGRLNHNRLYCTSTSYNEALGSWTRDGSHMSPRARTIPSRSISLCVLVRKYWMCRALWCYDNLPLPVVPCQGQGAVVSPPSPRSPRNRPGLISLQEGGKRPPPTTYRGWWRCR